MKTNHAENMREEYDFSQGKRGAVLPHQGKTRITIWIDTEILDWFRTTADREGRGYQTAMNAALRQYTQQNERPLHEVVRDVIREELRALRMTTATSSGDESAHEPPASG
jgi:uncharacterized protein (DUF4415 family)